MRDGADLYNVNQCVILVEDKQHTIEAMMVVSLHDQGRLRIVLAHTRRKHATTARTAITVVTASTACPRLEVDIFDTMLQGSVCSRVKKRKIRDQREVGRILLRHPTSLFFRSVTRRTKLGVSSLM